MCVSRALCGHCCAFSFVRAQAIEREILSRGPERIACVLTTSSCFAPRAPDRLVEVAKLCLKHQVHA